MSHDFMPEQQIFTALKRKNTARSTKGRYNNWANDAYLENKAQFSIGCEAPVVLSAQSQIYWFV